MIQPCKPGYTTLGRFIRVRHGLSSEAKSEGREATGRLPIRQQLLGVFLATGAFSVQDELPRTLQEKECNGYIVSAEARCRFPLIAILVGALHAHLVENELSALRLRMVLVDGNRDAANSYYVVATNPRIGLLSFHRTSTFRFETALVVKRNEGGPCRISLKRRP